MQNSELCNNVGSKKRQKSEEESKNRFFLLPVQYFGILNYLVGLARLLSLS